MKMKRLERILLLSCRSPFLDNDRVYPPLANLYLQASVQKRNPDVQVTVSDDYDLKDDKWLKGFDGIGVSVMTPQRAEAAKIARFVKERSNAVTFAGGPHVTHYPFVAEEPWDVLVKHDGEKAINIIAKGGTAGLIIDNMSVEEFEKNAIKPNRVGNVELLDRYKYTIDGKRATTMMTAKGCPMACEFCEEAGTKIKRTPQGILFEEIDDIKRLGYQGVYIFDDIFGMDMNRAEPIARKLKDAGLVYRCNGHVKSTNKDFLKLLADTGCREIAFGAESGSQRLLDAVHKRTTVQQNYDFVKNCHNVGIPVKAFMMIGLPGEDLETIAQTEQFISNSGVDDFQIAVYYPYRGTEIRRHMQLGHMIDLQFEGEGLGAYGQKDGKSEAVVRTFNLTSQELKQHRDRIARTYKR